MAWGFTGRDPEVARAIRLLGRDGAQGVVVAGQAGVGRSRFLDEVAERVATSTGLVARCAVATDATSTFPLGAFAPLVTPESAEPADPSRHDVLRALRGAGPPGSVLVVVDDAHLLDEASVALVHRLVTAAEARVLLSVRSDLRTPKAISALWSAGRLQWLDLGPLERPAADALVAATLPGDASRSLMSELWNLTRGYPSYLRALLDAAMDAAAIARRGGEWRCEEGLPLRSPRLVAMVEAHTGFLDEPTTGALEVLAMAGGLPEPVAHEATDLTPRRVLEARGLLHPPDAGEAVAVGICHPLLQAVIEAGIGPATRRTHARRLAHAWARHEGPGMPSQAVRWALEAGIEVAPEVALDAARDALAVFDFPLAERLARTGISTGPSTAGGHVLLAEVLRHLSRASEALEQLDLADARAADDDARARIAVARAESLSLLMGDLPGALQVLNDAARVITEPAASQQVAVERTFLGAFAGDFGQVVEAAPAAMGCATDPQTELKVILVTTFAQALSLELDGVDERIDRGFELAADQAEAPLAEHQLHVCQVLAMLGQARVGAAFDLAARGLTEAAERGEPTGFWAICVAFAGGFTGDLEAAADAGVEAHASLHEVDPFGVLGLAASVGTLAAIQAGRPPEANHLLAHAGRRSGADARAQAAIADRVAAWAAAQTGSAEAAAMAADAGRASVRSTHRLWGAAALHDAVRLGSADIVVDDLRSLVSAGGAPLAALFLAHAEALDRAEVAALDAVTRRFERAGCRLFAAEAEAQAAAVAAGTGDEIGAVRRVTSARMRWATCTGTEPVALTRAPAGLSPRQRDVARLACRGLTSRQIAEALVLSVRTVDNHLRRCYQLLGVDGREAMSAVLPSAG